MRMLKWNHGSQDIIPLPKHSISLHGPGGKGGCFLSPYPGPTYLKGMPKEPVGGRPWEVVHSLGQHLPPPQQMNELEET